METQLSEIASELLDKVRQKYLDSHDFNGLHLHGEMIMPEMIKASTELLEAGLIEIVSGHDFLNIHIRPWHSRRTVQAQIDELMELDSGDYGVCLYPTELAMKHVPLPERFENAPFLTAMARGKATLQPAYFSADVLETYRNDARYRFDMSDFGINLGISDDAYEDEEEPEKDKVSLLHLGFAYDFRKAKEQDSKSQIIRRVVAFYGDLDDLTPEHQLRWASYQVPAEGVEPHPVWYGSQMGHWPDGIGPFARLSQELGYLNELFERVWGQPLLRTTELPEDLGWTLRSDQREWEHFVHQLDKVLSENFRHLAFDAAGVPRGDDTSQHPYGTNRRLQELMTMNRVTQEQAEWAVKPLKAVRTARQAPAHALRKNVTDRTLARKQMDLLRDVNEVLINIRQWLSTHPRNKDWEEQWPDAKDYFL